MEPTKARTTYTYRVVSSNGAGIHGPEHPTIRKARALAVKVSQRFPKDVVEIERLMVTEFPKGSRYWMRRGSRWERWDTNADPEKRKPDLAWRNGERVDWTKAGGTSDG